MTDPPPKGLYCPGCRGVRLTVVASYRPAPGRKVRYRRCTACDCHITTVEKIVRTACDRRPKGS